jgi:hypothetical protein
VLVDRGEQGFHLLGIGKIGADRPRMPAWFTDLVEHRLRGLDAALVPEDHPGPVRGHAAHDRRTDTP